MKKKTLYQPEMLTKDEQESLRQDLKDSAALAMKAYAKAT
jgi:hypothetical protein